ncbi:hypothetical protein C1H46_026775 [Malus baccata]|uniref:Uncharacterized protein n=1 Tax=Malus baccata TaxID=106549 RepID=A0A540LME4_MALBA|nr:hypothetical protein C1H46_026775 [Malus baccata]
MYKVKKNSADLDCRKMIKNSFKQAHEFEKRRAESHSAIRPSVLSHPLSNFRTILNNLSSLSIESMAVI